MNKAFSKDLIGNDADSVCCRQAVVRFDKIFGRPLNKSECLALAHILENYEIKFRDDYILGSLLKDTEMGGVRIGIITICLAAPQELEFEAWRWDMARDSVDTAEAGRLIYEMLQHRSVSAVGNDLK